MWGKIPAKSDRAELESLVRMKFPYTPHPTPHTLNPTPHTPHPTPYLTAQFYSYVKPMKTEASIPWIGRIVGAMMGVISLACLSLSLSFGCMPVLAQPTAPEGMGHTVVDTVVDPVVDTVVNVDARLNHSRETAVVLPLAAGIYQSHVIGPEDGGLFSAWNFNCTTNGCRLDGTDCRSGWEHRYTIRLGKKLLKVPGTGKYATPTLALQSAPADRTFSLSQNLDAEFYVYDPLRAANNQGGVSLRIAKVK
ncbi:MAG: hypothetical protein F6J93_02610 [Oscillatoria sp. SIO1A7]|nr:hypothetical protein [Oscillatoria sp. SIO1A7]